MSVDGLTGGKLGWLAHRNGSGGGVEGCIAFTILSPDFPRIGNPLEIYTCQLLLLLRQPTGPQGTNHSSTVHVGPEMQSTIQNSHPVPQQFDLLLMAQLSNLAASHVRSGE